MEWFKSSYDGPQMNPWATLINYLEIYVAIAYRFGRLKLFL